MNKLFIIAILAEILLFIGIHLMEDGKRVWAKWLMINFIIILGWICILSLLWILP